MEKKKKTNMDETENMYFMLPFAPLFTHQPNNTSLINICFEIFKLRCFDFMFQNVWLAPEYYSKVYIIMSSSLPPLIRVEFQLLSKFMFTVLFTH